MALRHRITRLERRAGPEKCAACGRAPGDPPLGLVVEVRGDEPGRQPRPAAGDGRCHACGRVAGYRVVIQ